MTDIRYFPHYTKHLMKPCDSYPYINSHRRWNGRIVPSGKHTQCIWYERICVRIANPGKTYFLKLAAKWVHSFDIKRMRMGWNMLAIPWLSQSFPLTWMVPGKYRHECLKFKELLVGIMACSIVHVMRLWYRKNDTYQMKMQRKN